MAFKGDPVDTRRVFDPDTGYELRKIVRDVPLDRILFDLVIGGDVIEFEFDFYGSDERKIWSYHIDDERLRRIYFEAEDLGMNNTSSYEVFVDAIAPIISEAVASYDRSLMPESFLKGWRTEIILGENKYFI